MALCAYCGAPIRFVRPAGGWLHSAPLGQFKISRREADDIHADPPLAGRPLHRQTVIHPAMSRDYSVHNPRKGQANAL